MVCSIALELSRHQQLGSTGDAEGNTDQDAPGRHRHPFRRAERRYGTLDGVAR
jgi:hypothetical protein